MSVIINYDKLLKRIRHKYAIPIAAARRAEGLKDFGRPKLDPQMVKQAGDKINIALKELEEGRIVIRNEEMLKILVPKVK
ncbi:MULTISPECIES: DNA-directed RNA polymerase subunit omega [Kosmotoga]|jgi:DNA-directed RNA polymerase subunit omega|uniref:DNA-directed RNA polymerase subunit omega n=1 Tax=Kosmotoga olearia (strain ATCC BAA-1733 / DSM 21960 / TBF 19.5.1) TaxID=521045 RepID=RPOZ_KOSOT|nr:MULTISPECIES: DNA-directed RNA polymerase subunit omega [Kosmotoga]C5CGE8.1 RecName: Full=DNA-directed RNA polymerase subunit omega; Short=RNAP omega subunit; AltName: Full=RNA polymerase omega subunit; AltName: Full=Transcriptase subunit omega [Kosmotoga olearia TBF 19.5.1]ACR80529.1 DNA-directed RNA polymerase, omega subunit [Kosmotoga olearia TBF 19.5.1]MDI3523340.1 DNA-directed polymerase subunit omega [Kosmotoga sp.]MDK2953562.1 DNA-directed polymerase subunit omega [Kosmotoga sp.]OAA1